MLSAEIVLADGQSVTVSKARRPDLYWVSLLMLDMLFTDRQAHD